MFYKRIAALLTAVLCLFGSAVAVSAAEVDCDSVYCFTQGDFSSQEEPITGICITSLPESSVGTMKLGARVLRPGDILTADQASRMTFCPLGRETDAVATLSYLPIYENRVEPSATVTISIRGKEDKAPAAQDSAMETYKNLPNTDKLKVTDPEGQKMTYTVTRQPRRGEVKLNADGSYTYTPKKNKVGVDSFTYTATDPAGNVSREATVTITILKPSQSTLYTDTVGEECRFEAEWMKNTGIFEGENLVGNACFQPEKTVTRGEFVTMLVKALEISVDTDAVCPGYEDVPAWLRPYLAAAVRSGLTQGLEPRETFGANAPITGVEVAVMLQNALDLTGGDLAAFGADSAIPTWAQGSVAALAEYGIVLDETELTRSEAAQVLYQVTCLADSAPGMAVIRANRD